MERERTRGGGESEREDGSSTPTLSFPQASDAARNQAPRKRCAAERALHVAVGGAAPEREAVVEFVELARWLVGAMLGPRHEGALARIDEILSGRLASATLLDVLSPAKLPKLTAALVELCQALLAIPLEDAPLPAAPRAGAKADHALTSSPPGGRASSPAGGRARAASLASGDDALAGSIKVRGDENRRQSRRAAGPSPPGAGFPPPPAISPSSG